MPHTKSITDGIIYRPPNQSKFLDIFEENLPKLNTSYRETYFLGDFNINLFENGKYVFHKSSSNNKNLDSFTKKYHECCTLFGLKQLYCTGKTARIKSYCHKEITFRSLKNYSPEIYEEALRKLSFLNYELFDDIDTAYENFIQKVIAVIDNLALSKNKGIKGTLQNWFDAEIMEKISDKDKLLKKFKKSRLHVDKGNYKEARNEVQKLIRTK